MKEQKAPKKAKVSKTEAQVVDAAPQPTVSAKPAHRLSPEVLLAQLDEILLRLDVIEKELKIK